MAPVAPTPVHFPDPDSLSDPDSLFTSGTPDLTGLAATGQMYRIGFLSLCQVAGWRNRDTDDDSSTESRIVTRT